MTHTFHNPMATAFALFAGWQPIAIVQETPRRKAYILEKPDRPTLADVPVSAECVALARDAEAADVQDKAADLAEMTAADVDNFAGERGES